MISSVKRLSLRALRTSVRPIVLGLVLLSALCLLAFSGCNPSGGGAAVAGNSAPDYEIPTVDGAKIQLSQYRGKVVVLDFWAPWCGPCRAETPHLKKIADDYKGKDVVVIGLSIPDPRTRAGEVEQFVKEFGLNYTIGFAPTGMFEKFDCTPDADGAIPQTFVFGRDGRKIWQNYGFNPMEDGEKLQRTVEQATLTRPVKS